MHSPFVFDFIQCVLNNRKQYTPPASISRLRKLLCQDERILEIEDMGAGSRSGSSRQKQVKQVAATAVKPEKYAQLLFRLVHHYRPKNIIELGTSLGITTAYLQMANPQAAVTTIEGSVAIQKVALENFKQLQLNSISAYQGNFDTVLPKILQQLSFVDMVYIDGNHRYQPTINYFHQLLPKAHNHTVLIFDDIHWSKEMEQAWEEIKAHSDVRCSIDIFYLGFVFFRKEFKEKQHFTIRY